MLAVPQAGESLVAGPDNAATCNTRVVVSRLTRVLKLEFQTHHHPWRSNHPLDQAFVQRVFQVLPSRASIRP